MHQPTIDAILAMLDHVQAEYDAELACYGPNDPFEKNQHQIKTVTRERITREVLILAGRTGEPVSDDEEPPDAEAELVECYDDGVTAPADQMTYIRVPATGRDEPFCPGCIARQGMVL